MAADGGTVQAEIAGGVMLAGRFVLHPERPLAEFDTPSAPAVLVTDRLAPEVPLFALVCRPELPARVETMAALKGFAPDGLLGLVEFGPVEWPEGEGAAPRMAAVYEVPFGGRVGAARGALSADEILTCVVRPLAVALDGLAARGVTHRAIRPGNLYWRDHARTQAALGPCVGAPPGYDQPAACEPLDAAMAERAGRGDGTAADDLFALGMLIVQLESGVAFADTDVGAWIVRRIEDGSAALAEAALTRPSPLAELVRGLLIDDPAQRWTLADVRTWLDSRRAKAIRPVPPPRAATPFAFAGGAYATMPALAYALCRDWERAVEPLRSGAVAEWVRREFREPKLVDRLTTLVALRERSRRNDDAALVAKAAVLLDPLGPIRFKDLCVRLLGLGHALAAGWPGARTHQLFGELLASGVLAYWMTERRSGGLALADRLARWAGETAPGGGLERCLYELNRWLPCLTPLAGTRWVDDPAGLLAAIEAQDGDAPVGADRHVVAFLAARLRVDGAALAARFADARSGAEAALAALHVFAHLQRVYGPRPAPNAARRCLAAAAPAVAVYHNRDLRRWIAQQLDAAAGRGDLVGMLAVLEDPQRRRLDALGFRAAADAYAAAEAELSGRPAALARRALLARRIGRDAAAGVAAATAALMVAASLLRAGL